MAGKDGTQAAARAFAVLRHVFSAGDDGIRLTDIANSSDLSTTTVYRLLKFLTAEGFLSYDSGKKIYLSGPEIFRLAQIGAGGALRRSMRPVIEQIAEYTGLATYLSIREGAVALCIDRVLGKSAVDVVPYTIGSRRALGIGAAGIALLATLSKAEIDRYIKSRLEDYEKFSITPASIWDLLEQSRADRYVYYPGLSIKGIAVLGIPVETADLGSVAISVLGLYAQFESKSHRREIASIIGTAALSAKAWPVWPLQE